MKKLLTFCFLFFLISQVSNAQCVSNLVSINGTCGMGTCSGTVGVSFSGGALPLSVTLSDGFNTWGPVNATSFWQWGNLCPGIYSLTVVDANGDTCTGINNFIINQFPIPVATINVTNATCAGCNDGAATVNVSGGSPPYTYLWSNGAVGPAINGLPQGTYTVSVTDMNGCSDVETFMIGVGSNGYFTVGGNVYLDLNSNGSKDIGEPGVSNQQVNVVPGNVNALTNSQGDYAVVVSPASYDVTFQSSSAWNLTSAPSTYSANVTTASVSGLDFGIFPDSANGSAVISFTSGWPRCNWLVPYYLTIHNNGFTVLDGVMTLTYNSLLNYSSSSVAPFSHIGNVLTYNYSNLSPGQTITIVANFIEPAGSLTISSNLAITGTDAFGFQFAENSTLTQLVTCSYDPNDKAVQPEGQGASNFVTMDSWLNYMIRFQNTGNDTAFTVVLIDTMNAGLDLATFTLIDASHSVNVTTRPGNEVTFTFDNILLPDSTTNEPASNGYVIYRIKGNATNPDPTPVTNTAYIYFDLNLPIVTNSTLTTLSDNFLGIADVNDDTGLYNIFPNPMKNGALLKYTGTDSHIALVELMDISGRLIGKPQTMNNGSLFISKEGLSSGTYLVKITADSVSYLRLVVQ
ncbi:MAG: T9SS type A sorting domain-containing protein [Bacteroidetes bacterium]|nr:T9SS type A sorting domain-containing protein [Bacteroidota bacterium]